MIRVRASAWLLLAAAMGLLAALLAAPGVEAAAPESKPWIHTVTRIHRGVQLFWWNGFTAARDTSVTGSDVQYRVSSDTSWTDWSHTGVVRAVELSNLTIGTEYQVRVRATNSDGGGPWSDTENLPAILNRSAKAHPPFPVQVRAGNGEALVTWGRPSYVPAGQSLTGYVIRVRPSGGSTVLRRIAVSGGGATSARITGLTNATEYDLDVHAQLDLKTGLASRRVEFTPSAALSLSADITVEPSSLSVPVGGVACYLITPGAQPAGAQAGSFGGFSVPA